LHFPSLESLVELVLLHDLLHALELNLGLRSPAQELLVICVAVGVYLLREPRLLKQHGLLLSTMRAFAVLSLLILEWVNQLIGELLVLI
jgi:hypothetical protein